MLGLGKLPARFQHFWKGAFILITTFWCAYAAAQSQAYAVHSGPGELFPVVWHLSADTSITVNSVQSGWALISDGVRDGWINTAQLRADEPLPPGQIWLLRDTTSTGNLSLQFSAATDTSVGFGFAWITQPGLAFETSLRSATDNEESRWSVEAGLRQTMMQKGKLSASLYGGFGYGYENAAGHYWTRSGENASVALVAAAAGTEWQLTGSLDVGLRIRLEQALGAEAPLNASVAINWNLAL